MRDENSKKSKVREMMCLLFVWSYFVCNCIDCNC